MQSLQAGQFSHAYVLKAAVRHAQSTEFAMGDDLATTAQEAADLHTANL